MSKSSKRVFSRFAHQTRYLSITLPSRWMSRSCHETMPACSSVLMVHSSMISKLLIRDSSSYAGTMPAREPVTPTSLKIRAALLLHLQAKRIDSLLLPMVKISSSSSIVPSWERHMILPLPAGRSPLLLAPSTQQTMVREVSPISRRSEEHTSELQSLAYLVCRLLLEKK